MIEFATDGGITFVVNFVAGESVDVRSQFAAIEFQLVLFNRDVELAAILFPADSMPRARGIRSDPDVAVRIAIGR